MIARCLIRLSALGVLAYLALPLLVILGASFTATPYLAFRRGDGLDWYRAMLAEPGYAAAFATSTVLALAATAGGGAAYGARRPGAGAPRIQARRRCRRC